ncbi:hypothetical protein BDV98DRAFT_116586 [Pterulicium gracile]|uniref:Uncharacterized protein n=1 Tax=Pterulicium gracile TaxID=1884261 RepID=A0A5C3QHP6_9AGAR|nr:hypothetical protein BDV98DRAFT_116586 [Pterula gracilis]
MSQVTTNIVDDVSLRVQYPAASDFGWREGGDRRMEFMDTTHVTLTKGDAVSLAFNGTRVGIYGTVQSGRGLPPIQFVLDGVEIPTTPHDVANGSLSFHVPFCAGDVPDDKEHTLVATLLEQDDTDSDTFILDYFTYDVPSGSSRSGAPAS